MFGIMTKKDKRIKELEEQVASMDLKNPPIVDKNIIIGNDLITIYLRAALEDNVSVEDCKKSITEEMMNLIEDKISYSIEDFYGRIVLKGKLHIWQI